MPLDIPRFECLCCDDSDTELQHSRASCKVQRMWFATRHTGLRSMKRHSESMKAVVGVSSQFHNLPGARASARSDATTSPSASGSAPSKTKACYILGTLVNPTWQCFICGDGNNIYNKLVGLVASQPETCHIHPKCQDSRILQGQTVRHWSLVVSRLS